MAAYKKGTMSKFRESTSRPTQGSSITVGGPINPSQPQFPVIRQTPQMNILSQNPSEILSSYQKMVGTETPQSSFNASGPSSMGQLEAASMRLADAASRRTMTESALGSEFRRGEMGTEYGLRGQLAGVESGLKRGEIGTEYGLRGQLTGGEADISARQQGYRGLTDLEDYMRRQRMKSRRI